MRRKLRVIVADDEEFVRKGLSAKVAWEELDLELIGAVANGQEVLDILKTTVVDIVVTDIMMPEVDGLTLIERATEAGSPPRFIILSGYGEFEFAQKAMAQGVRNYVLKPTKPEDLEALLTTVAEEIRAAELAEEDQSRSRRELLRESTFRRLLSGELQDGKDLEKIWGDLGLEGTPVRLTLLAAELGETATPERTRAVSLFVERSLEGVSLLFGFELATAVVLLLHLPDSPREHDLHSLLEELEKLSTPHRRLFYTGPFSAPESKRLLRRLTSAMEHGFYLKNGAAAPVETVPRAYASSSRSVGEAVDRFEESLRRGEENVIDVVDRLLLESAAEHLDPGVLKSHLLERFVSVGSALGGEVWNRTRNRLESIEKSATVDELRSLLIDLAGGMTELASALTVSPQERAVRMAQNAIKQRYSEHGLSLKYVAEKIVYANADYLGRIFRQQTGKRFTDCLLDTRMAAARELLEEFPQLSIGEVAERVGYGENSQYFSSTFRGYYGVPPSSIRRKSAT